MASSRPSPHTKALPADARPRNRTMLLQALLDEGPQSRADLARVSGLTPTTVSAVTAELIADGLIEEVGRKQSTTAGKPATLLAVEPDGRHVIALDLSDDEIDRGRRRQPRRQDRRPPLAAAQRRDRQEGDCRRSCAWPRIWPAPCSGRCSASASRRRASSTTTASC